MEWLFQVKIDGVQEAISKPLMEPDQYSPIYIYTAKIEKEGKDYGKATISNLVLDPEAKGYILNEDEKDSKIGITIFGIGGTKGRYDEAISYLFTLYVEIMVEKYNLMKPILESWGPSYEIRFKIRVKRFEGQVLHLCTGRRAEDGVPTVEAINQRLEVTTIIDARPMKFITKKIKQDIWYEVLIKQKKF